MASHIKNLRKPNGDMRFNSTIVKVVEVYGSYSTRQLKWTMSEETAKTQMVRDWIPAKKRKIFLLRLLK